MARIHVDEAALEQLKSALGTAGEDYKKYILQLSNLIEGITPEVFGGDLASKFKEKFDAKRDDFQALANTIDEAEQYAGVQAKDFNTMMSETSSRLG